MKPAIIPPLVFGLLLALAGTILLISPLGRHLEEDFGLAVLFKLRGPSPPPADIVIINIDEKSAEKFGFPENPYKWPRDIYADLIQKLIEYRAAVIVFDVHFADHKEAEDDQLFAEAIRKAGNVILVERLLRRRLHATGKSADFQPVDLEVLVSPIPVLAESSLALAPFPLPKVPFRVNQAWTFKTSMGDIPTLPVVALQALALTRNENTFRCMQEIAPAEFDGFLHSVEEMITETGLVQTMRKIRGNFQRVATFSPETAALSEPCSSMSAEDRQLVRALTNIYAGDNNIYVNYYGPPASLLTHSIHQVLSAEGGEAQLLQTAIEDTVVFVGSARTSWSEQKDGFFTVFTDHDGLDLSGVEIAATVYANLRDDHHLKSLPLIVKVTIMLAAAFIACLISFLLPPLSAAGALAVFTAGGLLAGRMLFAAKGIWPPVITPLIVLPVGSYLSAILFKYIQSRRERKHMQKALNLYLPENVVEEISRDLSFIDTGDRMIYGACLLSDAQNYTTLSERLPPDELSLLMKQYFQCIFKEVHDNDGTVTNMIGDTMFALWPSTEPQPTLKAKACQAAVQILRALDEFNKKQSDRALPTRLGLHSGYLLMGNIGAEGHFEYAPVGDIVNTASRIEGLNKKLGTWLLASEETVEQTKDLATRLMGTFLLSGKSRPVTIYQILADGAFEAAGSPVYSELFPTALELFRARQWQQAESTLARCLELMPDDGPSHFYLELCRTYQRKPPANDWQGVIPVGK